MYPPAQCAKQLKAQSPHRDWTNLAHARHFFRKIPTKFGFQNLYKINNPANMCQ